jgi:hypothetical protein
VIVVNQRWKHSNRDLTVKTGKETKPAGNIHRQSCSIGWGRAVGDLVWHKEKGRYLQELSDSRWDSQVLGSYPTVTASCAVRFRG